METKTLVKPNRRGAKSREVVLDAAERLMADQGYDGVSVSAIVRESGIPLSSVYHYFGSKDGVLLAVMERGAERFFSQLAEPERRLGSATEHLRAMSQALLQSLDDHPDFLRLLIVFATQPTTAGEGEVHQVVNRVRGVALERLRRQLALAFGDEPEDPVIGQLAGFFLATIDGVFVAQQSGLGTTPQEVLLPLASAAGRLRSDLRKAT